METVNCIVCDSHINSFYLELINDKSNEKFVLRKCQCGLIFLNPRPDLNEIKKYYSNDYLPHNTQAFSFFNMAYRFVQKITFYLKYKTIKRVMTDLPIVKLLDVGSGDGRFLDYLKSKSNLEIYSNEPYYDLDYPDSKYLEDSSCDIITMWHSLEHVHNMQELFKLIIEKLKDNGFLILAVPNIDAAERKFFKFNWVAYDAPRHLYHFNYQTMKKLLSKYNFEILESKPIYQDTLFNIILSFSNLNFFNILKTLYLSFISFSKILINKNFSSSTIYICKKK